MAKNGGLTIFILLLTLVLCLSPAVLKDADPIDIDEALDNLNSADTGVGPLPSGPSSLPWMPSGPPPTPDPAPPDRPAFSLPAAALLLGATVGLRLKRMLLRPLKFLSNYVNVQGIAPYIRFIFVAY
ncbi:hypothetical protein QWJ34_18230 [Saccharibacillus sp. CPCC 101409]|uniref:hypothetical protein n=1 Tax=Saccharibacillus sp. CPCC 101409 TaxID=3058041 RepID=UPI0026715971|nr:hypothetical protein [Saccharibacillus sp. CPCC 101409]MDO3411706.1 hypothetical protein [Saccharibacillus sp. CPCC 101409]